MTSAKVLMVTMPWATPVHPSLALGLLTAILRDRGIESDCLYANMLLPRHSEESVYAIQDPGHYEDRSAGLSFVPHLYPHVTADEIANAIADRHLDIISREGHLDVESWRLETASTETRQRLREQSLIDIDAARICLDRCMEHIASGSYDVVGFSLTFETQLISSLSLARKIRQTWPEIRIMFGGSACASSQGVALLNSFEWVDAVCLGEGDSAIVPLVRALRSLDEAALKAIPGIAFRSCGEVVRTSTAEPMHDLDWIPIPDYKPYYEQKSRSQWSDLQSVLLFETSRGCWWGEKHLCKFCGLNADALTYRSKTAPRVIQEVATLCDRYDIHDGLQAVDNILDTRYFSDLIPMLIEFQQHRPVAFFFEIKSNLTLERLRQLAAAGFVTLQPGIEAFSDHILELMDKGATTFQQIKFIKWAQQTGISPTYNILMRNPGETAEDYVLMTKLLPFIRHLQPPNGIANMQLERYSPYFLQPGEYGLFNVRPKAIYKLMFPDENVNISDLVYQFDFDHKDLDAPELVHARTSFLEAVLGWKASWKPDTLVYHQQGPNVTVFDRREGKEQTLRLTGLAAELFLYMDEGHAFTAVRRRFPMVAEQAIRSFLSRLVTRRLLWHDRIKDAYLNVVMRVYDAEQYRRELDEVVKAATCARPRSNRPAAADLVSIGSA